MRVWGEDWLDANVAVGSPSRLLKFMLRGGQNEISDSAAARHRRKLRGEDILPVL